MRNLLLSLIIISAFPVSAKEGSFKDQAKLLLEDYARVDTVDWYSKGDTTFAENDGFIGVYRHLKVSVTDNALNMKMDFVSGPKRPDSDDFSRVTTGVCLTVFSQLLNPTDKEATWDDETDSADSSSGKLEFMRESSLDKVQGEKKEKIIDGWKMSIKRTVLLTTCSAEKI
ncbi:hypothetical protein AAF302_000777 [Pluralibacter gergoviae]